MNTITEKYKIWNVQKKEWFRPTYPGSKPGKNGKTVTTTKTEEIFFSQSGEMFLRENDTAEPCDKFTHLVQIFDEKGNNLSEFIPCLYSGFKDSEDNKIYAGHVVRIYPEDGEAYCVEIEYDPKSGTWNPCQEDGDYTYSVAMCKETLGWKMEILGHILENPELLP